MSKLEVDKIDPQSGTDLELGSSGDTVTIPTGVTLDASNATTTLPANVVTTDGTQTLTNKTIDASQLTGTITPSDNTVSLAKLTATGTKDATTFLRGDNTFAAAGLNGWSEDGANNNLLPASASAGIYLGVNSATASNLLDDYEEGTWTPSFNFSSGSVGYAYQVGTYRKIGKTVHVQFAFILNSASSPSGNTTITGLPFTTSAVATSESSAYLGITRNLNNNYTNLRAYTNDNNTVIQLPVNATSGGFSALPASDLQNTTQIFGNATYFTD
jgi:hypothetical protein